MLSLSANTNSESIAESFTSAESQVPYLAPCKQQENKWKVLLAFASHFAEEDFSGQAAKAKSHLECSPEGSHLSFSQYYLAGTRVLIQHRMTCDKIASPNTAFTIW